MVEGGEDSLGVMARAVELTGRGLGAEGLRWQRKQVRSGWRRRGARGRRWRQRRPEAHEVARGAARARGCLPVEEESKGGKRRLGQGGVGPERRSQAKNWPKEMAGGGSWAKRAERKTGLA